MMIEMRMWMKEVKMKQDEDVDEGGDDDEEEDVDEDEDDKGPGMELGVTHTMNRGHLHTWFQDNKIIWVTVLASIAAIQVSSSYMPCHC